MSKVEGVADELIIDNFALAHAGYKMGDLKPCPFCGKDDEDDDA